MMIKKDICSNLQARSLVLVGMMGAGKTTIGRRLAKSLCLDFVDSDEEIEIAAGLTIPDIFAKHGEAYFRAGEQKVIARLLRTGPQVLSVGGGAFMNENTRSKIQQNAISIWLQADLEVLMERVRRNSNRPLLQQPDPESIMRQLINERSPIYAQANITVVSRNVTHDEITHDIITALHRWLQQPEK